MKKICVYLCYIVFLLMIFYQIYLLSNPKSKIFYIFLLSLVIVATSYEGEFIGCSPGNCSLDNNKKTLTGYKQKIACQEVNRVNWRRSLILAFSVFVIMNNITSFEANILPFFLSFFAIYFYFNFDTYHRFNLACELERENNENDKRK
jgi:hypothetical protein